MGKHARIILGTVATVFFLWLALRNVDLAAVGDALQTANYVYLIPAAACTVSGFCVRALRWSHILRPAKAVPFQRLFPIMMVGFATNNLLPARIGEFVRAYLTGSREGVSRSTALATIVVERVCDGLTLLALMTVTLLLFPIPVTDSTLQIVMLLAAVVFGIATVVILGLILFPTRMLVPLRFGTRRLPIRFVDRVDALIDSFLEGLQSLRDPRALLGLTAMSVGIWLLECATFAFVLRAFPLGLSVSEWLAASAFLLVFVNLGIMVPSVPGYVGTYQFFATLALSAFAVNADYAFGIAVVAHAMQYTLITGIGLICVWRLGLRIGNMGRIAPERPSGPGGSLRRVTDQS
ncbi:MAG: flippase-like domain-containing protein [Chloroflexota bacterium]|nr:flippase-like domain-containing protein [Chloroflexota bacterium]